MTGRNSHGRWSMEEFEGRILRYKCWGSWNAEGCVDLLNHIKGMQDEIDKGPWGTLIDIREWELCPPEVWEAINNMVVWYNAHGLAFETLVYHSEIHRHLVSQGHETLYRPNTAFFTDYDEAHQWAKDMVTKIYTERGLTLP
ncbi:hypothetical protein L4C34_10115 [Vibrio profundum]|uniref:hypothetical protein n=1 Tax=Vibrio profundum TaxID=2910247 RepID=UPI003D120059